MLILLEVLGTSESAGRLEDFMVEREIILLGNPLLVILESIRITEVVVFLEVCTSYKDESLATVETGCFLEGH